MWRRQCIVSLLIFDFFFLSLSLPLAHSQHSRITRSLWNLCFWQSKGHVSGPRWGVWSFLRHSPSNAPTLNPSPSFFLFSTRCKNKFLKSSSRGASKASGGTLWYTKPPDTERWSLSHWLTPFHTDSSERGWKNKHQQQNPGNLNWTQTRMRIYLKLDEHWKGWFLTLVIWKMMNGRQHYITNFTKQPRPGNHFWQHVCFQKTSSLCCKY